MDLTHRPLLRSRGADRCLTGLVALILLDVALFEPLVGSGLLNRHLHGLGVALVVGLGASAVWTHVMAARVLGVLAFSIALIRLANFWVPDQALRFWDATMFLAADLLLAHLVARQVFGTRGAMNWHRVVGAVAIWLLAGLAFTQAYRLVAMHVPVAFLVQGAAAGYDAIVASLNYFSLVTLSTLGYGDIVPVHPVARGLANLEAIFGVMYPVVVISWLVSLEVEANRGSD
ncbi:MAG: two pore domain potassium channel family protein [Betaproteobacteria bacterium]|nr:two pore domain potassium channel family protein [Betaproteobacteria bacterium]